VKLNTGGTISKGKKNLGAGGGKLRTSLRGNPQGRRKKKGKNPRGRG